MVTATINRALKEKRLDYIGRTKIMLYRVFYSTNASEYGRCFSDKQEAEKFYNGLLKSNCYRNVKLQIG